jgi:acyl-CoA synthetase (AMP-forming)/AMP-acid ligase II
MDMHFATLWEQISDVIPDQPALIHGNTRKTWSDYDDRAARIATALSEAGLGLDSKIALYLHNCNEYLEAQYAIFKIRACPINVNYRYLDDELVYLLDNADAEAIFFEACYAERILQIIRRLPKIKLLIQIDDGTGDLIDGAVGFQDTIDQHQPQDRMQRDPSDLYMIYTGGTTGMPKGVMYENGALCSLLSMGYAFRGLAPPENPQDIAPSIEQVHELNQQPISLVACPLMHGTGVWLGAMLSLNMGGSVVTVPNLKFDADELLQTAVEERVTDLVIVGDAFAKPMVIALESAQKKNRAYEISSIQRIISSGVMWTATVKSKLLEFSDMMLIDAMGSSEGSMGISIVTRELQNETAKFTLNDTAKVFTDDDREVTPGSGQVGMIGTAGVVPLGYYKDPAKSAVTFREIEGVRYSFPGDHATVEADESVTLLGRGSLCINTGGEKVYPEEVEEAVKLHPAIFDCLVVGVPDEKFGEHVVAIASFRDNRSASEEAIFNTCRSSLAGYKIPRQIIFVQQVERGENGKADYKWAQATAMELLT